ncbi:ribosome small subunit-dependent GTPase A [Cucumibacter marinus]|uniref:ribosome small subunit-dependent GTPase A n=1 Tax=Cucumibacter marinus TaxID=1121252 RepID=UPI0004217DDC|nr:ribosome small subunit-dependent GTPase A [Cucumibacter marinus]
MTEPDNPTEYTLAQLGWSPFFVRQIDPEALDHAEPARVLATHRDALEVVGEGYAMRVPPLVPRADETEAATVGDFVLVDRQAGRATTLVPRKSLFKRGAKRGESKVQLIAANVDTLFIVTGCDRDFNPARIERYLALAREADVTPVVVLTKADLAEDVHEFIDMAARLMPGLMVEALDAREQAAVEPLRTWCGAGQTVALLGSSGVGKSTLVNSLTRRQDQEIGGTRKGDGKGRHTTTARAMIPLDDGGWLIDTPGMRELRLADMEAGLADVFADVEEIASQCRFSDCKHETEPGCAVRTAIEDGSLDEAKLQRYLKLKAEEFHASASIAQRRSRAKGFGKMAKRVQAVRNKRNYFED